MTLPNATLVFLTVMLRKSADSTGPGPDLHFWGSGNLLQTLMKHDLVDNFWLMIYPITWARAKSFLPRHDPAAFKVTESIVGSMRYLMNTSVPAQFKPEQSGNNNLDSLWNCGLRTTESPWSGCKHKAWGVSPGSRQENDQSRERRQPNLRADIKRYGYHPLRGFD